MDPKNLATDERFLRTREAAAMLACSRAFIHELIRSGRLRAVVLDGRLVRIPTSALTAFVEKRSEPYTGPRPRGPRA